MVVEVPHGLEQQLRAVAHEQGTTMAELICRVLEDWLEDLDDGAYVRALRADPNTEWVPLEEVEARLGA